MYDILIKNARIVDGTGAPSFMGSVAVVDGRLICRPDTVEARITIDAEGNVLAPGFIDAHSHGDLILGTDAGRMAKTMQGVTTEITGQCGDTLYPVSDNREHADMMLASVGMLSDVPAEQVRGFSNLGAYLAYADKRKLTANFKVLTGHATLRIAAMGFDKRRPTDDEMNYMKRLLRNAMEHGSMGLSSGLLYSPSGFAEEDELVELCKIVAEYDGIYATHMRNEAAGVIQSVKDSICVAERAGCRLSISHHKICGKDNWGQSEETLRLIREANARGVRVTADMYPYTASMSNLNVCLPAWFFQNGPERMLEMLKDTSVRQSLKSEMEQMDGRYRHCGGFGGVLVASAPRCPACEGKTVFAYAEEIGADPFDAYFDILAENGHSAFAIYFSMNEEDLCRIAADENTVIGSDGVLKNLLEVTHPRGTGSFPKAIAYFVREKKLLTLEQMVHKMTGMTAERMLLEGKGVIRDGYDADLVLFDPDTIADRSDYTHAPKRPAGIRMVMVGGKVVYDGQELTGAAPGRFIPHSRKATANA